VDLRAFFKLAWCNGHDVLVRKGIGEGGIPSAGIFFLSVGVPMKHPYRIAVTGTHGVGKTTLCNNLVKHFTDKGLRVHLIEEVARKSPLGINKDFNAASAYWIACKQICLELEAQYSGCDVIISDRMMNDPLFYLRDIFWNDDTDIFHMMDHFINELSWTLYDKIVWVACDNIPIEEDGIRDTETNWQLKLDDRFKKDYGLHSHYEYKPTVINLRQKEIFDGLDLSCFEPDWSGVERQREERGFYNLDFIQSGMDRSQLCP